MLHITLLWYNINMITMRNDKEVTKLLNKLGAIQILTIERIDGLGIYQATYISKDGYFTVDAWRINND
jgi:hypothetical protein